MYYEIHINREQMYFVTIISSVINSAQNLVDVFVSICEVI